MLRTKKYLYLLLGSILGLPAFADIDLNQLQKVDDTNKSKCGEYYVYKSETYCSTQPLRPGQPKVDASQYERINIVFDDRVWKPIFTEDKGDIVTVEYIPASQTINNWTDLVTTQYIPNIPNNVTLKDFVDLEIQFLKADVKKVETKTLEDTGDSYVFEFTILEPKNEQQHEIQYLRKQGNSLYIMHYVTRSANMGDKVKQDWLQRFKSSAIRQQ